MYDDKGVEEGGGGDKQGVTLVTTEGDLWPKPNESQGYFL